MRVEKYGPASERLSDQQFEVLNRRIVAVHERVGDLSEQNNERYRYPLR
jgi:hypothetical protein